MDGSLGAAEVYVEVQPATIQQAGSGHAVEHAVRRLRRGRAAAALRGVRDRPAGALGGAAGRDAPGGAVRAAAARSSAVPGRRYLDGENIVVPRPNSSAGAEDELAGEEYHLVVVHDSNGGTKVQRLQENFGVIVNVVLDHEMELNEPILVNSFWNPHQVVVPGRPSPGVLERDKIIPNS